MAILETFYGSVPLMPSLSFFLILLPVMLAVYYLLPGKARAAGLLVLSLGCYYLARGSNLALLVSSIAADYFIVRLLGQSEGKRVRLGLALLSVAKNLAVLAFFGLLAADRGTAPVLGLEVSVLTSLGMVLTVYRGELAAKRGPFRFGLACAFFPALYAGPLATPEMFSKEAADERLGVRRVLMGLGEASVGVFKTAVIGGSMYTLYREIRAMEAADPASAATLSAWCIILTAAFALYYCLSGLGDMAQGLALAFGYKLAKNFYYPYQSRSVEDFFERFNSTVHRALADFLRPLPERFGAAGDILSVLLAGALWGLWFGFSPENLVWGVYFAGLVLLEKYVLRDFLRRVPLLFCRIGTLLAVLGGFTILVGGSRAESLGLLRRMFRFYAPANDQILYLLSSNWLVLLVACLFATNAASLLAAELRKAAPRLSSVVLGAVQAAMFVLYIALSY